MSSKNFFAFDIPGHMQRHTSKLNEQCSTLHREGNWCTQCTCSPPNSITPTHFNEWGGCLIALLISSQSPLPVTAHHLSMYMLMEAIAQVPLAIALIPWNVQGIQLPLTTFNHNFRKLCQIPKLIHKWLIEVLHANKTFMLTWVRKIFVTV